MPCSLLYKKEIKESKTTDAILFTIYFVFLVFQEISLKQKARGRLEGSSCLRPVLPQLILTRLPL